MQRTKYLRKPVCGYCGRKWVPARGVSAKSTYCNSCKVERLEAVSKLTIGFKIVTGANGDLAAVPLKAAFT